MVANGDDTALHRARQKEEGQPTLAGQGLGVWKNGRIRHLQGLVSSGSMKPGGTAFGVHHACVRSPHPSFVNCGT